MKKHIILLSITISLVALVVSCDKKEQPVEFSIGTDKIDLAADGGEVQLSLGAYQVWTADAKSEWCMVNPANGNAGTVCTIKVDSTYSYLDRSTTVSFNSGSETRTLTINQKGYPKTIATKTTEQTLNDYAPYGQTFFEVKVDANIAFNIKIVDDETKATATWLRYKSYTQPKVEAISRTTTIRFDYDVNSRPWLRSATVDFVPVNPEIDAAATLSSFKTTQTAAPKIEPSRAGDSMALLAIARGVNMMGAWDPSQSMIYWHGIELNKAGRVAKAQFYMIDTYETIPYEVQFLTECENIEFYGNANSQIRLITLGDEILKLKKLKRLSLVSYGIANLPNIQAGDFPVLEELDISGNNFLSIPIQDLKKIPSLRRFLMSNNRRRDIYSDLSNVSEADRKVMGLGGELPAEIFTFNNNLTTLELSYNYFEGSIPKLTDVTGPILPNMKRLTLNLNRLTGTLPDWLLNHPHNCKWIPFTMVYNQEGKDSKGRLAKFDNVPTTPCSPEDMIDK